MTTHPSSILGFAALIERAAQRFPRTPVQLDRAPDITPERPSLLNFQDLHEVVLDAAATLAAAGVTAGKRVAVVKRNHLDILLLAAAANRLGALPALLSSHMTPTDMEVVLKHLGAQTIITDHKTLTEGALAKIDPAKRRETVLSLDEPARGAGRWADLRGGTTPPANPPGPNDPMVVTHTSGTTGVPKLVAQSATIAYHRMRYEILPLPGLLRISPKDRVAVCLQYAHARCVTAFMVAFHDAIPVLALSEPELEHVAGHLADYRPTVVETHPNIYLLWAPLTDDPRRLFSHTRLFANTFDAIHPATVLRMLESSGRAFPLWIQGWGQSESGATTLALYTARRVRRGLRRGNGLRNVGFTRPGWSKVSVLDPETKTPVRRGNPGQLHVKSPSIALTYVGQEDLFERRLSESGWSMGDIGRRRWTGGIDLLDRHIDQVDGVESCINLEDILLARLSQASEVVVVGDQDDRPRVVVCTHGDEDLDTKAWAKAISDLPELGDPIHLPWRKVPRTGTWKVRRPLLRELLFGASQGSAAPPRSVAAAPEVQRAESHA